jgi:serine phosphatase RsbU (regulator of sigma subunit)
MNGLSEGTALQEPSIIKQLLGDPDAGLAEAIQSTLVPSVAYKDRHLEAYGQTIPQDRIGGDLLDLVADRREVIAYVADVSGHGFRSAVLMAMVKTAMRYGLLLGQSLPALLDGVNRVLPAVKESSMFATLAGLRFDGSHEVEYIAAGHLPLVQYRRRQRDVVGCNAGHFPLGLFEVDGYVSTRIHFEPGDVFALVTDGVVETADSQEAEFGLERLENILCNMAGYPLSEIFETAVAAVTRHGTQRDDRTLLLIRALA